jgi:serine phosphatase RsbU (regulator of sigma subunit)
LSLEQMKQEIEAARAVQQALLPAKIPAFAGFHVDCVSESASQIGGDFCQIFPIAAGSALIMIGDIRSVSAGLG